MGRVAIVEDEHDIVTLYRMALESAGHEVVGAWEDPADLISDPDVSAPDVVILDERLRGLSGVAFLPELRRMLPGARVLVASADPAALELALGQGVDAVLKKPFALRRLLDEVTRLLAPQDAATP